MSSTLTYGHKLPDDGDKGSTFFDDLESNIAIDDSHTHDGTNSSLISSSSISNVTFAITSAGWTAVAGKEGLYRQLVTLPTGILLTTSTVSFINSSTGDVYTLSVELVNPTTYYVYINDNTINLTAIYV